MIRRFMTVFAGGIGIALAITGLEFADAHEPTLANALAGNTLYQDAGTIRILSIVILVLSIVLLIWESSSGAAARRSDRDQRHADRTRRSSLVRLAAPEAVRRSAGPDLPCDPVSRSGCRHVCAESPRVISPRDSARFSSSRSWRTSSVRVLTSPRVSASPV
jgi:hypothetical protein